MGFKDLVEVGAYAAAILAALGSWWQFRRNSSRERTRWLFELYQRFYESREFKELRMRLDAGDIQFVPHGDAKLLADFDDFLNFFEFTAFLQRRKELEASEVRAMFDYILRILGGAPNLLGYIRQYGYEELDRLLKELGYAH